MKIGLVIYDNLDVISGGYLYDRKLVEYLQNQGDQVQVVSLPWRNYLSHLTDNLSPAWMSKLRDLQVDVLLQDELNHPSLFWLNQRLKLPYKVISIVHHLRSSERHPAWLKSLYARVEHNYLNSVDGFVFNSHTTRTTVEAVLGRQRPHVVALPAGDRLSPDMDDAAILQRAVETGPLRLIFVGNVIWRKGLHTLLSALKFLPPASWSLVVAGSLSVDPDYAQNMRSQAAGWGEQVRFLGSVSDETLAKHLHASQVLVVPSSYEGYGIVYIEGMGFGLPALATNAGAAGEIITNDVNGYLIPPGDATALANHLERLIHDRSLLATMSQAARLRYRMHPSWQDSTTAIRQFLISRVNQ